MSYGYDGDEYSGLWDYGDTKSDVKKKAARIYMENYIKQNKK
jgi:hypothetical protein